MSIPEEPRPEPPTLEYASKPKKMSKEDRRSLRFAGMMTLLPLVLGFYEFYELGEAEQSGGKVFTVSIIASIYDTFGRYGVLAVALLFAAFWGTLFFKFLRRKREDNRSY